MAIRVKPYQFFGTSKVFGKEPDALTNIVRAMAQAMGKQAAAAVASLTDNSGGSAATGTIGAIPAVVPSAVTDSTGADKTDLESYLGLVRNAFSTVAAQLNSVQAKVPALESDLTDSSGGTSGDGTIAAITQALPATATSLASAAGAQTVVTALTNELSNLIRWTNEIAVACGEAEIVDNSGGVPTYNVYTVPAVSTSTGTAVSGADANANAGLTQANGNAILAAFAAAVKQMATTLNACTADSSGYLVAPVIATAV